MPFDSEGIEQGIGLALSGGGFRATLFHIGTLWRLNELGILGRLSRVSSVSGGSITAGHLALAWKKLSFDARGVAANFAAEVADPLRRFCERNIDGPAIGEGALLPGRRISDVVIRAYREHLFGDATLQDLQDEPAAPRFVFNATNLQTGVSFRFSKPYMGDYLIGLVRRPRNLLAQAVAASSAFPPFLSPVVVEAPGRFEAVPGSLLNGNPKFTGTLYLTDGGVYDNMGLETVWERYSTVLVSDAGAPSDPVEEVETEWHKQALTAMNVATAQTRALRKRLLIAEFQRKVRQGAYWGLRSDIRKYSAPDTLGVRPKLADEIAHLRTRLNPFSGQEQGRLINFGYALADAGVRAHAASEITVSTPPAWPVPAEPLSK